MKKAIAILEGAPVRKNWLKRIGLAGFLFFLIKGLVWLVVAGWLAWKAGKQG